MANAKNSSASLSGAQNGKGVSMPGAQKIATKVEKRVGGTGGQNFFSHTPRAIKAGGKHPSRYSGGQLSGGAC